MHRRFGYWIALMAVAAAPALADPGDPPARVARLNYISGSVSFRPGTVEDWTEATLNFPLTNGDHLWSEQASQTELHVGSTALRMGQTTALAILNLDDRNVQLSLTEGTLNLRVRNLGPDENYEIDTPNSSIALLRPGNYRIDVNSERNISYVTVWDGEADVTGAGATFPVSFGQRAEMFGSGPQQLMAAPPPGEFERFCETRDRREEQSQSARYVSRDMTGYEDLDQYGSWRPEPEYGNVWIPSAMPIGWAPYQYGHWAWVEPWGWTWIDQAPWGFAPYHYGRWAYRPAMGWFWVPGQMGPRPVYAPALVAFVGGVGFGAGVAWFPLGPREVYRPSYRVSNVYMRRMNGNDLNATNVRYVNRGAPGAITMVPRDVFVQARPVHGAVMRVDARMAGRGEVVGMTAPVAPTRMSVMANPDGRRIAAPPARFVERPVIARTAPPPPPVSFASRERSLAGNQGRPLDPAAVDNLRRVAPAGAQAVRTLPAPQGGFRRPTAVEEPARPAAQPARGMPGADPQSRPPARVEGERPPITAPGRQVEQRPAQPGNQRPAQAVPVPQPNNERPAQAQPRNERPAQAAPAPQPRNERPAQAAPKNQPKPDKKDDGKGKDK